MNTPCEMNVETVLGRLMGIDSQNPDLAVGHRGERALAEDVAGLLTAAGLQTRLVDVVGDRPNVIATLPGDTGQPTVVLEAHLDTVPAPADGLAVRREGRRLHGRGSCDTKGSLAAMIVTAARLARQSGPRPTVIVAGVVDEEYVMRGAAALLDALPTVSGVVIGEPTSLVPVRANNGFIRVRVQVRGVAAHSSSGQGTNAILDAARVIATLDEQLGDRLRRQVHALTGSALLSPTMVTGGTAPNIVPNRCAVTFDRRLAPGESVKQALDEMQGVLDPLRNQGIDVTLEDPIVALVAAETPATNLLVRAAEDAVARVTGQRHESEGVGGSTDACYLNGVGGLPCVVLGPGSMDQAHVDDEWVDLDEVGAAADIYTKLVMTLGSGMEGT
jgi:acetylornithine deacetylase